MAHKYRVCPLLLTTAYEPLLFDWLPVVYRNKIPALTIDKLGDYVISVVKDHRIPGVLSAHA